MRLLLTRIDESEKQTIGVLYLLNYNDNIITDFDSLELPYKENKHDISCIPNGNYKCVKRNSSKFGNHLHVLNVPNREYILIHKGNYHTDILGCILIGTDLKDINNDGEIDVIRSRDAMESLMSYVEDEIDLEIIG
jgi:hypothetical protein